MSNLLLYLAYSSTASSATLTVSADGDADYTSIQDAIEASESGDTIQIAAGSYNEALDPGGRELTLEGTGAPEDVELTVDGEGTVLSVVSGESIALSAVTLSNAGRGALVEGSSLTLTDVVVTGMSGLDSGAGIRVNEGSLTCDRCEISLNAATDGADGGGVFGQLSELSFNDSSFSGNTAERGGAVAIYDATLTMSGTTLSGNSAVSAGGAVYARQTSVVEWSQITATENSSDQGGAVYLAEDTSGSFSAGTYEGNTADNGGFAYAIGEYYSEYDSYASNEATSNGGAVYGERSPSFKIIYSDLEANVAAAAGGAVYVANGAAAFRYNDLVGNSANNGGGIAHVVTDVSGTKLTSTGNTFDANVGGEGAGGLSVSGAASTAITSDSVTNNVGQAYALKDTILDVSDVSFLGNEDALALNGIDSGSLRRVFFLGNTGDALSIRESDTFELTNSVFIGNGGDGISASDNSSPPLLINLDVVDNDRGIVLAAPGDAELVNVISAYNAQAGINAGAGAAIRYTNAWGNEARDWSEEIAEYPGVDGNLNADPEYTGWFDDDEPTNDVLLLSSTSPCRDSGDPKVLDIDKSRSDMGAYGGPEADDGDFDDDGYSLSDGDCDDYNAEIYPGAEDTWYDGVDSDCGGEDDYDQDGDGYLPEEWGGEDCDDTDGTIHPDADDPEGDQLDQNCDGIDGVYSGAGAGDRDGDGYTITDGDCNDDDSYTFPGAEEICDDRRDNDCDGEIDNASICEPDDGCACAAGGRPSGWLWALGALGVVRLRRRS